MIYFIDSATMPGVPYPELLTGGLEVPRGVHTMGGQPIAAHLPNNLTFDVRDGASDSRGLTDFMRGVGWLVVSAKLREVLDAGSAEVEYIPVGIRYDGTVHGGFFIANPLNRVRGVDLSTSAIELDELGIALSVDALVLDEAKFAGIPFAVLHETMHLTVQDSLADAIRQAGCTGCTFINPSSVKF